MPNCWPCPTTRGGIDESAKAPSPFIFPIRFETTMNTNLVWCPYTGVEVDRANCNAEHIIPLALGGSNGFTVPVDASVNAKVGSDIDAALSVKDFTTMFRRRLFDARGHSNKPPEVRVRAATYGPDQRPAQVTFGGPAGTTLWDAPERRELTEEELVGQNIALKLTIQPYDRLRFMAKVALSAGYRIYGDLFRDTANHADLRALMNAASLDEAKRALASTQLRGCFEYMPVEQKDALDVQRDQLMCATIDGSVVAVIPTTGSLIFTAGILGQWVGTLNVPATTDAYPNEGDHDLGHVVLLVDGHTEHISYREFAKRVYAKVTGDQHDAGARHANTNFE